MKRRNLLKKVQNQMKCPVCKEKELKSNVYPGGCSITCVYFQPFYDEDGNYHVHDGNTRTQGFSCSLGHSWVEYSYGSCPSCDFGHEEPTIKITNDQEIELKPTVLDHELTTTSGISATISSGTTNISWNLS